MRRPRSRAPVWAVSARPNRRLRHKSPQLPPPSRGARSPAATWSKICSHAAESTAGTEETTMLFMVIERFKPGAVPGIYRRLRDQGRSLPEGLSYEGSWIEAGFGRCFQLMACDDARLLQEWVLSWGNLFEAEIVPVVPSAETREVVQPFLG